MSEPLTEVEQLRARLAACEGLTGMFDEILDALPEAEADRRMAKVYEITEEARKRRKDQVAALVRVARLAPLYHHCWYKNGVPARPFTDDKSYNRDCPFCVGLREALAPFEEPHER